MSALETVPRCWQKAVFATCFRCRTEVPMRRMASMYAWECPTCGGVYPCHPTDADKVELTPIEVWKMDGKTGIPYPDFHTRNALGNELAIHDLQEPVTPVTPVTRMKIQKEGKVWGTGTSKNNPHDNPHTNISKEELEAGRPLPAIDYQDEGSGI